VLLAVGLVVVVANTVMVVAVLVDISTTLQ
jgi:hypothetical protein